MKEAHFIEERYKEKLSQMHYQQEIMMEKESKLAAEKLELAKYVIYYLKMPVLCTLIFPTIFTAILVH